MITQIVVREMQKEERDSVRQLLMDSYRQYESSYKAPEVWFHYLEEIRSSVDTNLADKILVAETDGKIFGTLQLYSSSDKAYNKPELQIKSPIIRLLAVHPEARGHGIAQALLKASVAYAKSKGAASLHLHSSDRMKKAIQLYEWFGFKRDFSKEFINNEILVKCYRLDIKLE